MRGWGCGFLKVRGFLNVRGKFERMGKVRGYMWGFSRGCVEWGFAKFVGGAAMALNVLGKFRGNVGWKVLGKFEGVGWEGAWKVRGYVGMGSAWKVRVV